MITQTAIRSAIIRGGDADRVAAYLPANYRVDSTTPDGVLIVGTDNAGWTLDDYVLPRLASGLMFGTEVVRPPSPAAVRAMFTGFGWTVTNPT